MSAKKLTCYHLDQLGCAPRRKTTKPGNKKQETSRNTAPNWSEVGTVYLQLLLFTAELYRKRVKQCESVSYNLAITASGWVHTKRLTKWILMLFILNKCYWRGRTAASHFHPQLKIHECFSETVGYGNKQFLHYISVVFTTCLWWKLVDGMIS